MSISPKTIYRFSAISVKITMTYFTELGQTFEKIYVEPQKALHSNSALEKEEQSWKNHTT